MNLSAHPLVLRARLKALLPEADISLQIKSNIITVFVSDPDIVDKIPTTFEQNVVRVICIRSEYQ